MAGPTSPLFAPTLTPERPPARPDASPTAVNIEAPVTLSDSELVGRLRNLFIRARSQRFPIVKRWNKNRRLFANRTSYPNGAAVPKTRRVPEIRPIIASRVAWITDQRPALSLTPAAPLYSPFHELYALLAQDMETAINAAWTTYGWENEIQQVVWDADQFDVGFFKVVWDASLADGLGDVAIRRVDPYTLYPDPAATSMDDANYFIEARTVSLQELDRRFPGAANKFSLQGYLENVDEMPPTTGYPVSSIPRANPGAIAPATSAVYGLPGQTRDHAATDDTGVTLLEFWLREHTTVTVDGIEKVYDCWRCVCIAGGHVLMNKRADELFPFKRHPYVRYTPEDLGEFYGQSTVELLSDSQEAINELLGALHNGVLITGDPIWVEDTRAGTQRTKLSPRPGQRLTKNAGAQAGWESPPTLSQMMPQLISFYIEEMEKISGLSAISRAQNPGGRMSADVLDDLQEAGFVRIRLALRNLEFALREVGQLTAAMVAEFYTEPRMVSLVGQSGAQTSQYLRAKHFYVAGRDGSEPLRFQVLVHAGSMLPTSRNARIAEANTLFAMGGIDRQALLEAHETPNRAQIIERMATMDAKGIGQVPSARAAAGRTS